MLLSGELRHNLMKITIEPSKLGRENAAPKVVVDSQHDEDSTSDAMDMLVGALIAAGHHADNINWWCEERIELIAFAAKDEDESFVGGLVTRCGDVEVEDYEVSDAFAKTVPTTGLDDLTIRP
jgi:hypothetical protein